MKLLIVANWKMNPQYLQETKRIFGEIAKRIKNLESRIKNTEIVICPPLTQLSAIPEPETSAVPEQSSVHGKASRYGAEYRTVPGGAGSHQLSANIKLGAQNVFWEQKGAYTGEVSPRMIKDLGCKYVIIGHSERRQYLKETNKMVNKKLLAVVKIGLNVIFCIGEKEGGDINKILKKQLQKGFEKFPKNKLRLLNIAYEPVWAIGTGKPCHPENALVAKILIKRILSDIFGRKAAEKIRILYGGSVDIKIAASYIKEAQMDGLLVGGASLDPEKFTKIVESVSK